MGASAKVKAATVKTKPKGSLFAQFFDIAKGVQGTMDDVDKFWKSISAEQQDSLLSLSLDDLRARAKSLDLQSKGSGLRMEERLDELVVYHTWKSWSRGPGQQVFHSKDSFRKDMREQHADKEWMALLPAVGSDLEDTKAGKALLQRWSELADSVRQGLTDQRLTATAVITHILKTMEEREHAYLVGAFLFPICATVCELVPDSRRKTTWNVLTVADLAKLPASKLIQIQDWLFHHVAVADIDHFALSPDQTRLEMSPVWVAVFDACALGPEQLTKHSEFRKLNLHLTGGPQPQRLPQNQNVFRGMLLTWLFEDRAVLGYTTTKGKHPQGAPVGEAHKQLLTALIDHKSWSDRSKDTKDMMYQMLKVRSSMQELAAKHKVQVGPCSKAVMDKVLSNARRLDELSGGSLTWPDSLIIAVLEREHMLTQARLHELNFERVTKEIHIYHLRRLLHLNEPEYNFLERVTEAKGRRSQNWERSSSDRVGKQNFEEFKALQADSDDHELALRFEKHHLKMEEMTNDDLQTQRQMVHLDTEIKELEVWALNMAKMADIFTAARKIFGELRPPRKDEFDPSLLTESALYRTQALTRNVDASHRKTFEDVDDSKRSAYLDSATLQAERLHMWACFQKHVWLWLYDEGEDRSIFLALQFQLRFMKEFIQDGHAAFHHLEAEVVNAVCTDPSEELEKHLVLPLIRERIVAAAADHYRAQVENQSADRGALDTRASTISQQLLEEEEQAAARAAAKKAKKERQKAKKQEGKAQQDSQQQQQHKEQQQQEQENLPPAQEEDGCTSSSPLSQPAADCDKDGGTASQAGAIQNDAPGGTAIHQQASDPVAGVTDRGAEQAEPSGGVEPHSMPSKAALPQTASFKSDEEAVERLLQCPLTKEVMTEPVIAADGHTYEKKAVQEWLQRHNTSPVTGSTLAHMRLVPNVLIRSVLARHRQQL